MKTFELQPTSKNILETFEKDLVGRNIDVLHFVELLNSIDSGISIALDANWGSGKTFFIKQTKMVLDAFNEHVIFEYDQEERNRVKNAWEQIKKTTKPTVQPQVSVYYDAWLNDNDEDPMLSLVHTILQNVSSDFEFKHGPKCIEVAAEIMESITGRSLSSILHALKSTDPLAALREKKELHDQIACFLDSLLAEQGNRLIVFVDELDRCKPTFAISLLERIKHYFSNERITFVFSVNVHELQHTIRQYYGVGFNASRYLNRFFDFRVDLPPAKLTEFYQEIGLAHGTWVYENVCKSVIDANHFTLRETSKFYRIAKTAAYKPMHDNHYGYAFSDGKAMQFCLMCLVPIMIGLKIGDQEKYHAFINGRDSSPLHSVMKDTNTAISICKSMLSANEVYEGGNIPDNKTVVRLYDKLEQVYEAIFIHQYTQKNYEKHIGEMSFSSEIKTELFRAVSALSSHADYDI